MRTGPPLASSSRSLSPGSQNSTPAPRLDRLGADPSPQPPTLFTDASEILGSCCRTWLRGPATTEIDSAHLRGGRRLNRCVNLILSQSPPTDVNAWEFTGTRCGDRVGICGLGSPEVRASGGHRHFLGPVTVNKVLDSDTGR